LLPGYEVSRLFHHVLPAFATAQVSEAISNNFIPS
jgi:hypothetical protein